MAEVQDRAAGVAADLVASEAPAAAEVEASGDLAVAVTLAVGARVAVGEKAKALSNGVSFAVRSTRRTRCTAPS